MASRSRLHKPSRPLLLGISCDVVHPPEKPESLRAACPLTYPRAVVEAIRPFGSAATVVLLPPLVEQIDAQLALCDAFILIGGDDPRTEPFGEPTHPKASCVHPERQRYDTALLAALREQAARTSAPTPVLGVCLGMQMMALCAGGSLHQHLPDVIETAAEHTGDRVHEVIPEVARDGRATVVRAAERAPTMGSPPPSPSHWEGVQKGRAPSPMMLPLAGRVTSYHHQGVRDAGRLRVVARAPDGVIEAIADPAHPFYLGVQWHPERTSEPALGAAIFDALIKAAREHAGRENATRDQQGRSEHA